MFPGQDAVPEEPGKIIAVKADPVFLPAYFVYRLVPVLYPRQEQEQGARAERIVGVLHRQGALPLGDVDNLELRQNPAHRNLPENEGVIVYPGGIDRIRRDVGGARGGAYHPKPFILRAIGEVMKE